MLRAVCLMVVVCALAGCSYQSSVVGPTGQPATQAHGPATVGLTVVVRTHGAEAPVPGAAVMMDDTLIGQTDSDGSIRTTVVIGTAFHIVVSAVGFIGNGAWGSVASEERWTFYLEQRP